MSGIAAISGQVSSLATASFVARSTGGATAGADGSAAADGTTASLAGALAGGDASAAGAAPAGMSVQTSSLISMAQPNANIQNMAALILSMLLNKSNDDSKDKDDAWKMLAGMALLGAMANQNQNVSLMQSTSVVSEAYGSAAGAGVSGSAGAAVNFQG